MTSKMNTKLRLVRCPKCWKILPELPEVLVYECGGCGCKLQAKKPKNATVDTTLQRLEEDPSGKQKMEQASNDNEASSSSNQITLANPIGKPDRNSDHIGLHKSTEDQDAAKKAENGTIGAPSGGVDEYSSSKQKMKQICDERNGPCSSTELSGHGDPESSPEAAAHNRMEQEVEHYQGTPKKPENVSVDATSVEFDQTSCKQNMEQLADDSETSSSLKQQLVATSINGIDRNNDHNEDPESSPESTVHNRIDQHDQEFVSCRNGGDFEESSGELTSCSFSEQNEIKKPSREAISNKRLIRDSDGGSKSSFKSSLNQQLVATSINGIDRNNDHNEDPESSPESTVHNRIDQHDQEFVSCRNGGDFDESSGELTPCSFSEQNEIKKPSREAISNKRLIRDSDGGSKSSFKSLIAEKLLDTRKKKMVYVDEDDVLSEDESVDLNHHRRLDRFGGTNNYYGYEGSVSSFEATDNQVTRKNRTGLKGDQHFRRRNEFHPLNDRLGKDVHRLNEFHANPRHFQPMIPENPKMERLELLKMVRELQDQLERTNISNSQQLPSYYNHALNNPGRYGHRMAFSGETTAVNGSSCYQYGQPDRHFSAQLPRQHIYGEGPHYRPNTYYSPRYSGPSSPQHHSEPDFFVPIRSNPDPDEYQHRNDITKKKRYVRPIAGGSPWITCYGCLELLQLPQSFLVFKKRSHSLRCGACMKVLNFTLSNGTHVSRYYPEEAIAAPPCSEVEDYEKSTRSRADPVSCSDISFQKSCSTETDKNASQEFSEERKVTMSRDPSGSTRPPSSKISRRRTTTSEIEEVEPTNKGSPLHWLMGYASPSKVIRG